MLPLLQQPSQQMSTDIMSVITYIGAIAISTERIVEVLKSVLHIKMLANTEFKIILYYLLALIVALGLVFVSYPQSIGYSVLPWYLLAILASSGSGVWNQVLSTLTSLKPVSTVKSSQITTATVAKDEDN